MPPASSDPERRRALGAIAAAGLAVLAVTRVRAESTFDLSRLMQILAQVRSGEATFVEVRTVAMLERPLESSGRLWFQAPDTFVRETLKPRHERIAIVGNTLTMNLDNRTRTIPLDSVPEASMVMEAIRGTLTGDRETLERNFSTSVSGTAQHWAMELVPREARVREKVAGLRVSGQQAALREVTVALADGDKSVMTIEPVTGSARPASAAN
jgi:outer membrane lipoprotein-sorting protein